MALKLKLFKIYLPVKLHEKLNFRADSLLISPNHLAIYILSSGLYSECIKDNFSNSLIDSNSDLFNDSEDHEFDEESIIE
jgi:hypothetical protein